MSVTWRSSLPVSEPATNGARGKWINAPASIFRRIVSKWLLPRSTWFPRVFSEIALWLPNEIISSITHSLVACLCSLSHSSSFLLKDHSFCEAYCTMSKNIVLSNFICFVQFLYNRRTGMVPVTLSWLETKAPSITNILNISGTNMPC